MQKTNVATARTFGSITLRRGPTEEIGYSLTTSDGEVLTDSCLYMRLTYTSANHRHLLYRFFLCLTLGLVCLCSPFLLFPGRKKASAAGF